MSDFCLVLKQTSVDNAARSMSTAFRNKLQAGNNQNGGTGVERERQPTAVTGMKVGGGEGGGGGGVLNEPFSSYAYARILVAKNETCVRQ